MLYYTISYYIIQCISRLGALSTRICIILTKSFHIIHTRAHSPEVGSGVCPCIIQGRMPFTRTLFCLRKPFNIIHTRAQSPDIGTWFMLSVLGDLSARTSYYP